MAKRMADTEVFEDPFVMGLDHGHKLLWFFVLAKCNHAGIWKVNMMLASMLTGAPQDEAAALKAFGEKIQVLNDGYWWIKGFCAFQYGELNAANKTHASVLKLLEKFGVSLGIPGNPGDSPIGAKDKDRVKVKDTDKSLPGFKEFWDTYPRKVGKQDAERAWVKAAPDADTLQKILAAIRAQRGSSQWLKDGGEFIPHPSTWLNGKRWQDVTGAVKAELSGADLCKTKGHMWAQDFKFRNEDGEGDGIHLKCARCPARQGSGSQTEVRA